MNGLEEIKKIITNFAYESQETKAQIAEIENKRGLLALKRNEEINNNANKYACEINELGQQISKLGNESQKLQNKLDFKLNETKKIVNLTIDNLITDGIRKIRKIEEERQELEEKICEQKEKRAKYEIQKNEFYERFGRLPELSENAQKEDETQNKKIRNYEIEIKKTEECIQNIENELVELASIKRNLKNGNWMNTEEISENAEVEETIILPLTEEFQIEEAESIEDCGVETFETIEKAEIGEIDVEPIQKTEMNNGNNEIKQGVEQIDEIELLARSIVEEIIAEQTKDLNINKVEENNDEQEIITFENKTHNEVTNSKIEKETITISNIIVKVEDGEIVYKAQITNGDEIKVYPTLEVKNVLLNDKEYREEIGKTLVNYAVNEHKILDNNVIKKIDPTICEVLEKFARRYKCSETQLIYNYAMSFSNSIDDEIYTVAPITYNLSYLKNANLSKKEKNVISKICKKAIENEKIDIIGEITIFNKSRYMIKKIFNINNVKTLTEGKYE